MAEPTHRELLTIPETCRVLKVARRTVYNWLQQGLCEWVRTPGGSIRIYADTLIREVSDQTRTGR